jgi:type IV conjugative transfer system protein TraL
MSNALTRHVILNKIDAPLKILIWTKGEIGAFIMPALMGLMVKHAVIGVVLSFVNYRLYKAYQGRFGEGQFSAVCYWFLPSVGDRLPAIPPFLIAPTAKKYIDIYSLVVIIWSTNQNSEEK